VKTSHVVALALLLAGVVFSIAYGEGAPKQGTEPGLVTAINCPPPHPSVVATQVSDC
jgi:hypothetical protein